MLSVELGFEMQGKGMDFDHSNMKQSSGKRQEVPVSIQPRREMEKNTITRVKKSKIKQNIQSTL
jgi:hypothetical protein